MKHIDFVMWMVCWPFLNSVGNYLCFLQGIKFSDLVEGISAIIVFMMWVWVGSSLWKDAK